MAVAGDFGNTHTSYFNQFDGNYAIDGQTGDEWAVDQLERITRPLISTHTGGSS